MSAATGPRWYSVNNMGMATLCADKDDAEDVARTCDIDFPRQSPHRAVQLVEASALDTERAARIEAQQRLADMQELAAKSGLAHRMAVQAAVEEAVAAERERLCAAIKAADDKASDDDYMLDSDDCISVIMGTWEHGNMGHTMTPTQKPRIKRDYSITKLRFMWFCIGQGCLGIADTPSGAYGSWMRSMRVLGRIPYQNFWS